MRDLTAFMLDGGVTVTVEPQHQAGATAVSRGSRLIPAEQTLREALEPAALAAAEALDRFRAVPHRPDKVEISFGVTLDGKLGGVIASATVGAHLQVTLRWEKATDEPASPAD